MLLPLISMTAIGWIRWFCILVVLFQSIAAAAFTYAISSSDTALDRVLRYDVAWSGAGGRLEMARLQKDVARFALTGDPADAKQARLSYQILLGRMRTWNAGAFHKLLDTSPRLRALFDELFLKIEALENDLNILENLEPEALKVVLADLGSASEPLSRIGTSAYSTSLTQAESIRDTLRERQFIQHVLIAGLFVTGIALLVLTTIQNRSLTRANQRLRDNGERFAFLASHDGLTDLPNRTAFDLALNASLERLHSDDVRIAVLAIDLDGFKAINDTLGHGSGDALLISVANRLSAEVSSWNPRNVVARFGGDEFMVLLHLSGNEDQVVARANQLRQSLRVPHTVPAGTVIIDASMGWSLSGKNDDENTRLQLNADLALNQAKLSGRGSIVAFGPEMRAIITHRNQIDADLSEAIKTGGIVPFYQLQVELGTGRIIGVEALARWRRATGEWISPGEFIPIAESTGQIVEIGRLMLEAACRDARSFPLNVPVSVNISVVQLMRDDIVSVVSDLLAATGLPSHRLRLEVTESAVMADVERALEALSRLKALGVSISLDDFGTGYSSLAYLRSFAWDELKIDRSFVQGIGNDPHSLAIVKTVVALACELEISVVAEGIESHPQHQLLHEAGCMIGQGYLYSKPVPLAELDAAFGRLVSRIAGWRASNGHRQGAALRCLR
ncbi:bifunctional diguanylate cyclase/phosphodiesterase [Ensifer sp. LCM 4579]|uniref:putative bifunctional diguanylate cyclase/phosphodiesterase n=1 Tax=Ensifer sp. LCM 4579 TaxID=1848292 RepID=UPI0008D96FDC|nr:EAL domain-containing protein [Ensifer sp. LCM 4579]OHV82477.1 hypothetical protein LCM4579_18145 [Ensifer sp. LCM 4579]